MLVRVDIENLVIVEHATFAPGPGLTAVTGETGAGKTLLATAISLLFGGDADASQVGPGGSQAWIEGEFEVPDLFWEHPDVAALAAVRPGDDEPLVLARRIDANGRSRALAWGRTVAKADLAAAGHLLVATAGQHVQVRLRSPEYQRSTLDEAGGSTVVSAAGTMREGWADLAHARAERDRIIELQAAGDAHIEELRDSLRRIAEVMPSAEDEEELRRARDRARHHTALVEALAGAASVLDGSDGEGGAIDLTGRAYGVLDSVSEVDPDIAELARTLLDAQQQLGEVASAIGSRVQDLAEGPGDIDQIEERLSAYDELHRRFGGTTSSVLAARDEIESQLATFADVSGALDEAEARAAAALDAAERAAAELTQLRRATAGRLSEAVASCLHELGMESSTFHIDIEPAALGPSGADRITFLLAPSAHIPPRPVGHVASGGELSRIALALLVATTAHGHGLHGTILFDEIDAGIGGHTAHAVAALLRRLADQRQVVCITHLPQVAARADSHVVIEKRPDAAGGARTTLRSLDDEDAVEHELARMLGAATDDAAVRSHVRQLRAGHGRAGAGSAAS